MIRFVIRLDDPSATSNRIVEERILDALTRHGLCATFAVIPFNIGEFPLTRASAEQMLAAVTQGTLEVAQHGYMHSNPKLSTSSNEFEGISEAQQRESILAGKALLESVFERPIVGFVPPFNCYDTTTLKILEQAGFAYLSSNLQRPPRISTPLRMLPLTCRLRRVREAVSEARRFDRLNPVVTLVMHHYDFPEEGENPIIQSYEEFDTLLAWIGNQRDIRVMTLDGLANELSPRDTRHWVQHEKWRNRLPWRFRQCLPGLCMATRPILLPWTQIIHQDS